MKKTEQKETQKCSNISEMAAGDSATKFVLEAGGAHTFM